ncbi:MAG TPA: hypothetical protein VEW28_10770 [Candidatus Kapabacteria bacterium]|nr:hypothetical protein [Candidatus Kapabacteria bacterium]
MNDEKKPNTELTPGQKFEQLVKQVVSVPKERVGSRKAKKKRKKKSG